MSTLGDFFTEVDVLCGPANTNLFYKVHLGLFKISKCLLQVLNPRCLYLSTSRIPLMSWKATFNLNLVLLFVERMVSIFCISYNAQNFDGGKPAMEP